MTIINLHFIKHSLYYIIVNNCLIGGTETPLPSTFLISQLYTWPPSVGTFDFTAFWAACR